MNPAKSRQRALQALGVASFLFVSVLLGLLAWRLTPPEGPPLQRPRRGLVRAQVPEDANLVLITIDGLRTDRLGSYGESPLSPTPHLDHLVSEAYRFEQAVTPVPASFPAHVALLTGYSPLGRKELMQVGGVLPQGHATLAEIMQSSGFRTAAFVGSAAVGRASGLARGFQRFDEPDASERPATARFLADRKASEVVGAARDWLDDNFRARFFLWVQLADPLPPHPAVAARPLGRTRDPYDAEVEETDAEIGRLLARLSSLGVMGHTLVAFTSSFGAGLGEHGETGAGLGLYDDTIRVPMALRLPGVGGRDRSIPEQVRLFDLMPTLLDLLRLRAPETTDGQSVVPLLDPGSEPPPVDAVAETVAPGEYFGAPDVRALRAAGWKMIEGVEEELYDLRRDPSESRNLAPSQRGRIVEMRRSLASESPGGDPATARSVPPEGAVPLLEEGIVALRAGDGARARRALEDLKRLLPPPTPPASLALLGAALRMQGRTREALSTYEEALAGLASDPAPQSSASAAESAIGPPADLAPAAPLAGLLEAEIGACRRLMGQDDAALAAYRESVAARPDDVDGRLALADLLTAGGQSEEAIEELRGALARAPGEAAILAAMGRAYLRAGQAAAAILPLRDALKAAPWLARPWFDLGQAYEAMHQPDEAQRAYQDFLVHVQQTDDPLRAQAGERLRALQTAR